MKSIKLFTCILLVIMGFADQAFRHGWIDTEIIIYIKFQNSLAENPVSGDPIARAAFEEGCDPALLKAIAQTECNGSNCVSASGALGPFQFLPTTWVMYAESDWDIWDKYDSARAACRMVIVLELPSQTTREGFVTRFAGLDGGLVWNYSQSQANEVWVLWKAG